jgi:branched-chain amino acid transport system permease protein
MSYSAFEAFLVIQCIYVIAGLGHFLPLSMRQLDVGVAGYFAVGAYLSSILTRDYEVAFPLALLAGAAGATAGALSVNAVAIHVGLRGFGYAIFSLSFAESLRIILNNTASVGGSQGVVGIAPNTTLTQVLLILAVVVAFLWGLDRTRLGYLKTAIADDELIVPIFGVPLAATKLVVFGLGGALAGLAGGLYAHYVLFIRPDDFGFAFLLSLQLPIVFGGVDRFYGAILGMAILGALPEIFRELGEYRLILTAAVTLVVLILRPSGLVTHEMAFAVSGWLRKRLGGRRIGRQRAQDA